MPQHEYTVVSSVHVSGDARIKLNRGVGARYVLRHVVSAHPLSSCVERS